MAHPISELDFYGILVKYKIILHISQPTSMFMFRFRLDVWNRCNKMGIKKNFPNNPANVILSTLSFLQKWSILLNPKDKKGIDKIIKIIYNWMKL
jgi:hypothetical protein